MTTSADLRAARARLLSRRWFLQDCGVGMAGLALSSLVAREAKSKAPANPLAIRAPHFKPKAKRVIYMFMAGAPSHLELFDPKPELQKRDGQLPPADLLKDYRAAFINPNSALLGPKYKFSPHGKSGIEFSELIPNIAGLADDLCVIRSLQTDAVNHAPGQIMMNTGSQQFGRPSFGSWTLYGLGSESETLPGYVVLTSAKGTSGGASNYGCGFLPTVYGGIPFRSTGDPVLYLSNPAGFDARAQRASLDTLNELNELARVDTGDPEIAGRIQSYEMAYQLQTSAPELMDLSSEPAHVLEAYGITDIKQANYARNCLLARRLIERGVRFVQLFHQGWDQHGGLPGGISHQCRQTDQASAALVTDLKRRGLLEDTLVIWGGEFGRTPYAQGDDGRDHNNKGFTMWMAGGGVKGGFSYGSTDPTGAEAVENPMDIHDWHATILWLMGFDHERLTYNHAGRDFRLTDVKGNVHTGIMA